MKKILATVMTMSMIFLMCSCGGGDKADGAQMQPTVDDFMTAVKAQDEDAIAKICGVPIEFPALLQGAGYEDCIKALDEKIFDFDYTIVKEEVNGNEASVDVKITTYPFEDIMTKWTEDITLNPSVFDGMSEEEKTAKEAEMFMSRLNEAGEKTYTKKVTLELVKIDGTWIIEDKAVVDSFLSAIYGGAYEA